jgi:hypothetical protein
MKTTDTKEQFINLRAKGLSYAKISDELKVSRKTLIDWNNGLKEEVANRKALELEALFEKYFLLKEHRVALFGSVLGKISDELSKRDFSDLGTVQLMDMMLKYNTQLKDELVEPVLLSSRQMVTLKEDREFSELLGV